MFQVFTTRKEIAEVLFTYDRQTDGTCHGSTCRL